MNRPTFLAAIGAAGAAFTLPMPPKAQPGASIARDVSEEGWITLSSAPSIGLAVGQTFLLVDAGSSEFVRVTEIGEGGRFRVATDR